MPVTPTVQEWIDARRRDQATLAKEAADRNAFIRANSPDGMTAMERALKQIEATGRRTAINLAKSFARQFKRSPARLNGLAWNLSQAEPADGIREVRRIARQDGDTHQLVGAMIFFRWARRHERAVDRGFMLAAE